MRLRGFCGSPVLVLLLIPLPGCPLFEQPASQEQSVSDECAPASLPGQTYELPGWGTITDLGALGGEASHTTAFGMNSRGEVICRSGPRDCPPHGFLWSHGTILSIDMREPVGVNDAGQIVGAVNAKPPGENTCDNSAAAVLQNGSVSVLPLINEVSGAEPVGISSAGVVFGQASSVAYFPPRFDFPDYLIGACATEWRRAVLWEPREDGWHLVQLGLVADDASIATDMNRMGEVVGTAEVVADEDSGNVGNGHAVMWRNGLPTDLGTLGGNSSHATAVNDLSHVVGISTLPPRPDGSLVSHAFLYRDGQMIDLGALPPGGSSEALDINNAGVIAGTAWPEPQVTSNRSGSHAVLWENREVIDLNAVVPPALGIELLEAIAINDAGQIATNGTLRVDNATLNRAFLLTPRD